MFLYRRVVHYVLISKGCPMNLIRGLSSELLRGLSNGMIYKTKYFVLKQFSYMTLHVHLGGE